MKLRARDKAEAALTANTQNRTGFRIGGIFDIKCYDAQGNLKWTEREHNLVTNEGLDDILDVYLSDGTQDATEYIGLKGTGTPAAGDTLASHASWSEFTDYTGDRQAWVEGGVSSQSIDNSGSPAAFPITGSGTVAGAFMTNASTGTSGILFAVVNFSASRSVSNGDTINVTYTISASDDGI